MQTQSIRILILFFLFSLNLSAQKDFNTYYNQFLEGYNSNNLSEMKTGSENLTVYFSDEFAGFYLNAYYQILAGNLEKAQKANNQAMNIQPLLQYPYLTQAYIEYSKGNSSIAIQNLEWASQLNTFQNSQDILDDISKIESFTKKDFSALKAKWKSYFDNNKINAAKASQLDQCVNGIITQGKACTSLNQLFAYYSSLPNTNPIFKKILPNLNAITLYYQGQTKASQQEFERFINLSRNDTKLYWRRSHALNFLSVVKDNALNTRGALLDINEGLKTYGGLNFSSQQEANMVLHKMNVLSRLDANKDDIIQTAYKLEQIANRIDSDYCRAKAYGTIGAKNFLSRDPQVKQKARDYVLYAYNIARRINDQELLNSTKNNYALIRAEQGFYTEASELIEEIAQTQLKEKQYQKAQNTYNNLGSIFFLKEDYINANKQFEKSISLVDKVKKTLNARHKLEYMNQISETYEFLIMGYKQTNEIGKLYNLQEQSRSGYLKELLGGNVKAARLADAKSMLKDDELLLMYSLGKPGEIIITAITKNSAEIRYNFPLDRLIQIKKKYTDRIKRVPPELNAYMQNFNVDYVNGKLVQFSIKEKNFRKEDFVTLVEWTREVLEKSDEPDLEQPLNEFMRFWYDLTLSPVEDLTAKYRNIIISASSELNYLPFEAFKTPENKYFIEDHNVRYISNVSIWKHISNRNYSANRKSVIAFGGAIYQPSGNVKATARNIEDFYKISDAVKNKIAKDIYNFKPELQAIGFGGANYLEGTLKEVQYIGTLAKDAKIVTGLNMTESDFKNRSRSGELEDYKYLIISTHGFTGDVIPEFSGLMFSQPNNGDANEDTFLLAPEIANLNLKNDLIIMSACDTGVGKLYGGEGINGLNTAFISAGANSTMLSLWPVDDSGTAITMQLLFKNIIQNNLRPDQTLNEIKRAFIKGNFGERGKSPKLWAPFLYNGK